MIVTVEKAAELIKKGENVAIPTETVYGLAADACNALAIQKTYDLKGRPADNPLIVHVSSASDVTSFSDFQSHEFEMLTKRFWPGPLTVILPKRNSVLDILSAGLDSVALRMPDHNLTLSLLKICGPVTAPSANRSGHPSPTKAQHVLDDFDEQVPVLDGGECKIGIESTVLDLTSEKPAILRPGKISAEEISDTISKEVDFESRQNNQFKKSPGTRFTHYKPRAEVRWMADKQYSDINKDALYIFHTGSNAGSLPNVVDFNGDFNAFARSLYDLYRTADKKNWLKIYIQPLPTINSHPILPALKNRIERSAGNN